MQQSEIFFICNLCTMFSFLPCVSISALSTVMSCFVFVFVLSGIVTLIVNSIHSQLSGHFESSRGTCESSSRSLRPVIRHMAQCNICGEIFSVSPF